jgi:hypothetical protein
MLTAKGTDNRQIADIARQAMSFSPCLPASPGGSVLLDFELALMPRLSVHYAWLIERATAITLVLPAGRSPVEVQLSHKTDHFAATKAQPLPRERLTAKAMDPRIAYSPRDLSTSPSPVEGSSRVSVDQCDAKVCALATTKLSRRLREYDLESRMNCASEEVSATG